MPWSQSTGLSVKTDGGVVTAKTSINTDLEICVDGDGMQFKIGAVTHLWPKSSICQLRTRVVEGVFPSQWVLDIQLRDGEEIRNVELLRSYNEVELLTLLESASNKLGLRFTEHTGRSVETDEHSMNVVQQLANFPERWPRPLKLDSIKFGFNRSVTRSEIKLPTVIPTKVWGIFLLTIWASIGVGLIISITTFTPLMESGAVVWPTLLFFITIIGWMWFNAQNGLLESRHRIIFSVTEVRVKPMLFGIFPGKELVWSLEEFNDVDSDENGRLTFLIADKRYSMTMHRRESEWLVGEVATQLEHLMAEWIVGVLSSDKSSLIDNFKKFDSNQDGTISLEEFKETIDSFSSELSDEQKIVLMRSIDTDADGAIDYTEFTKLVTSVDFLLDNKIIFEEE